MARSDTLTLIPLDTAARYLGINQWHFNGIETDDNPFVPNCPDDWYQHNWQQSGKLSRDALAEALQQAEQETEKFLMWSPLPRWYEEEVSIPSYYRAERRNWRNNIGNAKSVYANRGYVFEVGQRSNTFIDTPATVFSDPNADGTNELVTVTVVTTVTEAEELRVYYPGKSGADVWEIRPLTSVSIAAGVATITFPKYLIVLEDLLEKQPTPDNPYIGVDGKVDTNFLTEVDVYRVYTDPSVQATFYTEPDLACGSDIEYTEQDGALLIRDMRLGTLAYYRADWDATTEKFAATSFSYYPNKTKIRYRAGWRDMSMTFPTRQMNPTYERLIVFYALSLLDLELCGCDNTRQIWHYLTRDLADGDKNMPWNKLGNPFGTAFSALRLWEALQPIKLNRPPRKW